MTEYARELAAIVVVLAIIGLFWSALPWTERDERDDEALADDLRRVDQGRR